MMADAGGCAEDVTESYKAGNEWLALVTEIKRSEESIKTEAITLRRKLKAAREKIGSLNIAATATANAPNSEMAQELSETNADGFVLARKVTKLTKRIEEMRQESDKLTSTNDTFKEVEKVKYETYKLLFSLFADISKLKDERTTLRTKAIDHEEK